MRRSVTLLAPVIILAFAVSGPSFAQEPAGAPDDSIGGRLQKVGGAAGYETTTTDTGLARYVGAIINGAMSLLGVIFVAQMVYAGWLWMTAAGEEDQLTKAKHIIRRSIIGLAIVLGAWAITYAVLDRLLTAAGVS